MTTPAKFHRYRRQMLLPWLGEAEQNRLARSGVLIARVGGLGGALAQHLAMAGVGRIVFFHHGNLAEEDLHRMVLMDPEALGSPRAPLAAASLRRWNPALEVEGFDAPITSADAHRWLETLDLAIGAAPTFEERLILNDAAMAKGRPYLDAAMYGDETSVLCVRPGATGCLRCLLPAPAPWQADFPVLGAVSGMVGSLAALIAVRILVGRGSVPWGEWLHADLERFAWQRVQVTRRPSCTACASAPPG